MLFFFLLILDRLQYLQLAQPFSLFQDGKVAPLEWGQLT